MPLEQPELLAKYWYRTGAALRKDATDIQMYGFFPSTWRCLRTWLDEPYESLPTQSNLWFDDFMTFLESVISATFSGREGFLCFYIIQKTNTSMRQRWSPYLLLLCLLSTRAQIQHLLVALNRNILNQTQNGRLVPLSPGIYTCINCWCIWVNRTPHGKDCNISEHEPKSFNHKEIIH